MAAAHDPSPEGVAAALPYRRCVGLVVTNHAGLVFAGKRRDTPGEAWQMPQGGIDRGETPRDAALRELAEETGIPKSAVRVEAETPDWLRYDLPPEIVPQLWGGRYRGQEQRWFLVRFLGDDDLIDIDGDDPEFSAWAWMPPATILERIVPFKRDIYRDVFRLFGDRLA